MCGTLSLKCPVCVRQWDASALQIDGFLLLAPEALLNQSTGPQTLNATASHQHPSGVGNLCARTAFYTDLGHPIYLRAVQLPLSQVVWLVSAFCRYNSLTCLQPATGFTGNAVESPSPSRAGIREVLLLQTAENYAGQPAPVSQQLQSQNVVKLVTYWSSICTLTDNQACSGSSQVTPALSTHAHACTLPVPSGPCTVHVLQPIHCAAWTPQSTGKPKPGA